MCVVGPSLLVLGLGRADTGRGCPCWGGSRSAHTHSPTEEIERKLNVYHKGAKIWKMLIFCQVGLSVLWPRRRIVAGWGKIKGKRSSWGRPRGRGMGWGNQGEEAWGVETKGKRHGVGEPRGRDLGGHQGEETW